VVIPSIKVTVTPSIPSVVQESITLPEMAYVWAFAGGDWRVIRNDTRRNRDERGIWFLATGWPPFPLWIS